MKDRIMFFDSEHSYYLNGEKVHSVGSVIKRMTWPFKDMYWLSYKAIKDVFPEEAQRLQDIHTPKPIHSARFSEEIINPILMDNPEKAEEYFRVRASYRNAWDYKRDVAAFRGTQFHKAQEDADRLAGGRINPFTKEWVDHVNSEMDLSECDNYALTVDLKDLKDGYYTELLIFDHELGICGQADMVWIQTKGRYRYVWISDHKTNEKKPQKSGMDKFLAPIDNIPSAKHHIYRMQINLYAHMMYRAGFKIKGLAYEWIKKYDAKSALLVPFDYDKPLMKKVVDNFL